MISVTRSGDTARGVLTLALVIGVAGAAMVTARRRRTPFDALFQARADRYDVPVDMLRAIAVTENAQLAPAAVSPPNRDGTRDYGLMQINEKTAASLGVKNKADLLQPETSIELAADLLARLRKELGSMFNTFTWIAAYNAGAPAIRARGIFNMGYVGTVLYNWQLFSLGRQIG